MTLKGGVLGLLAYVCGLVLIISTSFAVNAKNPPQPLVIWLSNEFSVEAVSAIAKRFTQSSAIPVRVESPPFAHAKFPLFAPNGNGPDIFIDYHHRLGRWANQGLLASVDYLPTSMAQYVPLAVNSLKYQDQYYGYPLGIEVLSLAYNKNLVANPPTNWYQMQYWQKILMRQGFQSLVWPVEQTFYSFPFVAAFGGYSFAHSGFAFDAKRLGLSEPGASRGIDFLRALIAQNWLSLKANPAQIMKDFSQQQLAMMLVLPRHWHDLKKLGFSVGLTSLPSIENKPLRSFINVSAAYINQHSQQQDIAAFFIENYLTTETGLATLDKHVALGVPAYIPYLNRVASNPWVQTSFASLRDAQLTPNIPEIGRFFDVMSMVWRQLPSDKSSTLILQQAQQRVVQ
ncbi:extracellular solute-binding protein [Motilimonas eburnea]|uniref:extracellular solute-binding protein n=1 Tax=Motilimonas eburnea TaxID=1737488 RepID=UPI001E2C96C9|nr:extracellular solute-binding protein [Motilimonas eburnea]MCE2572478.1 extracellular solute-binding protein [Motilimonas eburnea]